MPKQPNTKLQWTGLNWFWANGTFRGFHGFFNYFFINFIRGFRGLIACVKIKNKITIPDINIQEGPSTTFFLLKIKWTWSTRSTHTGGFRLAQPNDVVLEMCVAVMETCLWWFTCLHNTLPKLNDMSTFWLRSLESKF